MRLTVCGFRCHRGPISLDLPDQGLNLIPGPSGSGKTTWMEAIAWALQGKMSDVLDAGQPDQPCWVRLELSSGITIYRQKRPERLLVNLPPSSTPETGQTYEDEVAQQLIDNILGSRLSWEACSYLRQRQRNLLLTGSNNEKMQILNELSFSTEDPDQYIAVIDSQLTQANVQFTTLQHQYTNDLNIFQHDITVQRPDFSRWLDVTAKERTKGELQEFQSRIDSLAKEIGRYRELSGQRTLLRQQHEKAIHELHQLDEKNIDKLEAKAKELSDQIQQYHNLPSVRTQLRLRDQIRRFNEELEKLQEEGELLPEPLEQLMFWVTVYDQRKEDEAKMRQYLRSGGHGEDIDSVRIQQLIDQHKEKVVQIDLQHKQLMSRATIVSIVREYAQQKHLLDKHGDRSSPGSSASELQTKASDLTAAINTANQSKDVLTCPHCDSHLRLLDRRLCVSSEAPVSSQTILDLQRELVAVRQEQEKQVEIQRLVTSVEEIKKRLQLVDIDPETLVFDEWLGNPQGPSTGSLLEQRAKAESFIHELQRWFHGSRGEILQGKILDRGALKRSIRAQQLGHELAKLQKDLDPSFVAPESLPEASEVQRLQGDLERIRSQLAKIDQQRRWLSQIESQLNETKYLDLDRQENPELRHREAQQKVVELQQALLYNEKLQRFIERKDLLEQRYHQVVQLNQRLMDLQRLRAMAIEVECETLQSTVDVINATLNDVLENIFDLPIRVTFSLFKEMKTKAIDGTRRVKPVVNITIGYKGNTYSRLNMLSGGEGDRVSLATTVALSRLSNCPFVMVDEAMSSIDGPLKEACIDALREAVGHKALYCINHEVVEGHYDHIVRVTD